MSRPLLWYPLVIVDAGYHGRPPSHHGQGQENQPWPSQIKVFPDPQRPPSVSISRPGPSELRRRPGPSELPRRGLGREPPTRSFLACPKPTLYDAALWARLIAWRRHIGTCHPCLSFFDGVRVFESSTNILLLGNHATTRQPRCRVFTSGQWAGGYDPEPKLSAAAAFGGDLGDSRNFHEPAIRVRHNVRVRRRFPSPLAHSVPVRPISGWVDAGPCFVNITNTGAIFPGLRRQPIPPRRSQSRAIPSTTKRRWRVAHC